MKPEDLDGLPPEKLPFPVTRAVAQPIEARASENSGMPTMVGHFSTFGDWYEVNSHFEGHFLERVAPNAFDKTISKSLAGRASMKVLYDHGQDPQIGNKVLGKVAELRTDDIGPAFVVPMFDTSYNRDLAPGLEAGEYGVSFRFTVEKDDWDHKPARSDYNPDRIPERTITEARVYEFGPVTFPANPMADIGTRSTTDTFYQRARDPEGFEALLRSAQVARAPQGVAADESPSPDAVEPPPPDTRAAPPSPPPVEVAQAPQDPPEGGSSDSRKEPVDTPYVTIDEKRARIAELNESMKTRMAAANGKLAEDEQIAFDNEVEERDALKGEVAAYDANMAKLEVAEQRGSTIPAWTAPVERNVIVKKSEAELHAPELRSTTYEGRNAEVRDDAKRILEKTRFARGIADQSKSEDKVAELIDSGNTEMAERVKYTSSPAYLRAFEKFLKSGGRQVFLTPEEQRGTALAVGVDGTGGFTVPFAFDPTVIAIGAWTGAVNPYRAACRVVTISGTDTWNALTATAVVATRTTEAAAATEQGPTFAQPQYVVKRVQGQITASFEMFQDRTDLASEMSRLIAEAKDNEEEASWATGNGSGTASIGVGPVTGTSGSYTRVSTASGGTLAAGDFDTLESNLPVRHRFRAQWFANRLNIRRAQAVETAGGKLFQQSQYFQSAGNVDLARDGNTGLRLLGYPVNESPSLPTSTATTITGLVLLNVDQYVIVDRVGLSVQFIPFIFNSSALATGQQALYFLYRNHAAPLNTDSGRILQYL